MIRAFNKLGKTYLKKVSDSDRKLEFLNGLTIEPKEKAWNKKGKEEQCYEIIFDFNLKTNKLNIELGEEVDIEKRKKYFGFKLPAANNSKLFLTSNNWNYHLLTIPQSLKYLADKRLDSTLSSYYELLSLLNKEFCNQRIVKDSKGKDKRENYFNLEKLDIKENQKIKKILIDEVLKKVPKEIKGDKKNQAILLKNMEIEIGNLNIEYQECLEKIFDFLESIKATEIIKKISSDDKFFTKLMERYIIDEVLKKDAKVLGEQNIYTITIDGRRILETEYKNEYIEFMYFALKEIFFVKKELVDSTCGCCGKLGNKKEIKVTKKVDIPTKFYNTNQPSFFENLDEKSYHKALGLCEECFENIRVGISRVHEELHSRLFGTDYYLIPTNNFDNFSTLKKVKRQLSTKSETNNDEIEKLKNVNRIEKKNLDIGFNILFWEKNQAEFIVVEELQNLKFLKIEKIFKELKELNNLEFYEELNDIGINYLYFILFPNKESHPNLKDRAKLCRKEALILFSEIILNRRIDYGKIINNFISIYMKKYFKSENKLKKDNYPLDALKMNIIISWINSVSDLEGGINLNEGKSYIELSDKDMKEFFDVHKEIYSDNYYRQGLVILGYLINKVKYQQDKKKKKSTILDRLNYDGISPKRIKNLVADVIEMLKIYKEFDYNGKIFSEMMDRLQGIEDSKMNKDEVVFYILTGVGLGRYIGIKFGKIKGTVNQDEDGGENDDKE